MALKLRVISDHYKALGKRSSQLFGVTGGRIGRAQDNDWVLPDPDRYVSSHHVKVGFRGGKWVLEDTSTNGTFINGSDTPASLEGPYSLQDGDRLRLGDYELLVSIDERNDFPSDATGQLPTPKRVRNGTKAPEPPEDLGEELDITDLLSDSFLMNDPAPVPAPVTKSGLKPDPFVLTDDLELAAPADPRAAAKPTPAATQGGFNSLLESLTQDEGERTVAHGKKSDDWQMQTRPYDRRTLAALTPASLAPKAAPAAAPTLPPAPPKPAAAPAPTPAPRDPERSRRAGDHVDGGVDAFCRGAGIDPSALPSDAQVALLTLAGQLLRETVMGLTETLKVRSDVKDKMRLSQTMIQPAENNPLKFSPSVDEALLKLLAPHGSRYLGPVDAIRDSFADLRAHHNSLMTAMQAGMDEFMNRIEPGELQERFDRGLKRGSLLGAANKMKYWDLYGEFYQALNQRNEQGLPIVFAEELARTYAERAQKKK
ncbi:type VI secretion system protein [Povalibacter uvarum]|uniref:Type VI secretion system protein n=1 Tax=Povalibacter uvarum TaxID=732238 RepID=A0A841HEI3_9GAMM|nr:type VI secretion system-associated FHA domain protein TagH [Povalibacter uvarum]MBB6091531.1 type VI secretion system protein [Povalibacter uvarum]